MADGIKRWSLDKHAGLLFEAHQGKFVRYVDHAAKVVRLEAHIAELETKLSMADPNRGFDDMDEDESR